MSFLAKIFGTATEEERQGISIGDTVGCEVPGIRDLSEFLRALPELLPQGSILYLEGTSAPDVIAFLERHPAPYTNKVAAGTIWPRPTFFHIQITPDTMHELAGLCEIHATAEVCFHVHAYRDGQVLVEQYDAFSQPLWISRDVAEDKVAHFCKRLGVSYKKL